MSNDPINLPSSRRNFLSRSALATLAGGSALILANTFAKADNRNDRGRQHVGGDQFRQIRQHENDHVDFLVDALGKAARPRPSFHNIEQSNIEAFLETSQALENTGVGAYLGAAPIINDPDYLAAAGSILTIEARHAGFLNVLRDDPITGNAEDDDSNPSFEDPLTIKQVVANAGGFIKSLNGGPPLTFSTTPSDANDIAILNFALALEYLEADFYNVNVKKFF